MLRRLRDRFRLGSKRTTKEGRPVENVDATAAAAKHGSDLLGPVSGYPPGYVKGYDEGRPRH